MPLSSNNLFRPQGFLSAELAAPIRGLQQELLKRDLTPLERAYFSRFLELNLAHEVSSQAVHESLRGRFRHHSPGQPAVEEGTTIHVIAEMRPHLEVGISSRLVTSLKACHLERYFDLPRAKGGERATPLFLAVAGGNAPLALQFLKNGADPRFSSGNLSVADLAALRNDDILTAAFAARIKELNAADEKRQVVQILRAESFPGGRLINAAQVANEISPGLHKLRNLLVVYTNRDAPNSTASGAINELRREIWDEALTQRPTNQALKKIITFAELEKIQFPNGLSLLGDALARGDTNLARDLYQPGTSKISNRFQSTYTLPGKGGQVNEEQLTQAIMSKLDDFLPPSFVQEALSYFAEVPSTFQLYLYLLAREELIQPEVNPGGLSFFQVASNALYIPMERRRVSEVMEFAPKGKAVVGHAFESDILLLLNESPDSAASSQEGLKFMERYLATDDAVSYGYRNPRVDYSPASRHWMLSRIGSLGYSFSRLRFDAMSAKVREPDGSETRLSNGLIADFGGEYISNEVATQRTIQRRFGPQPFGTQFYFAPLSIEGNFQYYSTRERSPQVKSKELDEKTSLSLRQAYYLVSNPNLGTLIIRNSSPEFGRFLLSDAALYLDRTLTEKMDREDFLYPSPRVLKTGINPLLLSKADDIHHINLLLDELQGALQLYREWKFNTSVTTAWEDLFETGKRELVGGHLSPGFEPFVKHLGHLHKYYRESQDVALSLGFVHPDFPSWRQYPFQSEEGATRKFLPVDDRLIECLEHLACGEGDERELRELGVRNFVQQAGLSKQSELLVFSM